MSKEIAKKIIKQDLVDSTSPNDVVSFATNLKTLVVENKLYSNIKGKNYVNVEGWQIAGAFMGLRPILKSLDDLSSGAISKYRAEVDIVDIKNGNVVGKGIAICSNKEYAKRTFEEYAIASMAQTRAIGKAYRSIIGWVMKMAGYEVTPAEEAETIAFKTNDYTPSEAIINYEAQLKAATNLEMLAELFTALPAGEKVRLKDLKDELKAKFVGENK